MTGQTNGFVRRSRWASVPGWPGYEVSDQGRVRSVPRTLADGRTAGGTVLRQRADRDGYLWVDLRDGARRRTAAVHVLVALAFRGRRRGEVRHLDDQPWNNTAGNLRWGTRSQNRQDRERNRRRRKRAVTAEIDRGSHPSAVVTSPVDAGGAA